MIRVHVLLFGDLRRYLPAGSEGRATWLELVPGTTVRKVLDRLTLPDGVPKVYVINHVKQPEDTVLQDGDRLCIFPPMTGG